MSHWCLVKFHNLITEVLENLKNLSYLLISQSETENYERKLTLRIPSGQQFSILVVHEKHLVTLKKCKCHWV
jgi:hypothetical protein